MKSAKNEVQAFREAVRDLVVPELRAISTSLESLRMDMERARHLTELRNEVLREQIKLRQDNSERLNLLREELSRKRFEPLFDKPDLSIRERLSAIEAILSLDEERQNLPGQGINTAHWG